MLTLYTSPGACSLADHIVLRWIGKPFQVKVINRDERKAPEFLALNPAGAVPVLVDDGWALTQNAAILQYLCDLNPEAGLNGDGTPKGRAEVNRWLSFLNADVHPAFHPVLGASAALGSECESVAKELARAKLHGYFKRLDEQLAGKQYLTGARSIADPYLFVVLRWARAKRLDLAGMDDLAGFGERMHADPGVSEAMQVEGLS